MRRNARAIAVAFGCIAPNTAATGGPTVGTTLVAVRDRGTVYLAADSRATRVPTGERSDGECKIKVITNRLDGHLYIASAGVKSDGDGTDMLDMVAEILSEPGPIRARVRRIEEEFVPLYTDAVSRALAAQKFEEKAAPGEGRPAVRWFVVGFEAGAPVLLEGKMFVSVTDAGAVRGNVTWRACEDESCAWIRAHGNFTKTGHPSLQSGDVASAWWRERGWVKGIREVFADALRVDDRSGGPVDILRITAQGACWEQVKDGCRAGLPMCGTAQGEQPGAQEQPTGQPAACPLGPSEVP